MQVGAVVIVLVQIQILSEEVFILVLSSGLCEERVEEVVYGHVCLNGANMTRGGERWGESRTITPSYNPGRSESMKRGQWYFLCGARAQWRRHDDNPFQRREFSWSRRETVNLVARLSEISFS